jgi:hypothetical protein
MDTRTNIGRLYPYTNLEPDQIQRLIVRARAEQAQAIRSAFASLFRWLRKKARQASAKPRGLASVPR